MVLQHFAIESFLRLNLAPALTKIASNQCILDSLPWKLFMMAAEAKMLSRVVEHLLNVDIALGFVEKTQTTALFSELSSMLFKRT